MIAHLDKPHSPARWFHYDMAGHIADECFFGNNCLDVSDFNNWLLIYEEMRNAAYDTTAFDYADSLYWRSLQFEEDTILIGLMDFDYYEMKEVAMTTGFYFTFDTVNDVLYDKYPRPSHPFLTKNMFTASPLAPSSFFVNPVFRIDPDYLFIDDFNSDLYIGSTLIIDFGDGQGFNSFDVNSVSYYTAAYPGEGSYVIKAYLLGMEDTIKRSKSGFRTLSNQQLVPPSETWTDIDGLRVGIYFGCNNTELTKPIIYLEGIDVFDFIPKANRTAASIYADVIQRSQLAQLQNHGYDFVIVDWKNSRRDMVDNAMFVVGLIDELKEVIENDHQFVLIGESMGGVIGRYALSYMETDEYFDGDPPEEEQMHNTRLFISYDSPQQGANVPMALQTAYKHFWQLSGNFLFTAVARLVCKALDIGFDGKAVQQLLIDHFSTKDDFCDASIYACYDEHNAREDFMDELLLLRPGNNGYPEFCKNVAVSNGSIYGGMQTRSNGQNRVAGDYLLDFESETFIRILGESIRIAGIDVELTTNPDGQDQFYYVAAGTWRIKVQLYWFGVRLDVTTSSLAYKSEYGNLTPYCVNPGGVWGIGSGGSWAWGWQPWLLIPGVINQYYSDGMHFNFIPVQSALDYSDVPALDLDHNIEQDDINDKFVRTPFDVIIGIPESMTSGGIYTFNRDHSWLRNEWLDWVRTCVNEPAPNDVGSYLLNEEIGTEHFFLDNLTLNRTAMFQSEWDMTINGYNPNYEYPGQSTAAVDGAYSREDDFIILQDGYAIFMHNANGSTGPGFTYNTPVANGALWEDNDEPLEICCIDMEHFQQKRGQDQTDSDAATDQDIRVWPNPAREEITLSWRMEHAPEAVLITDVTGRAIAETKLTDQNAVGSTQISLTGIPAGIYVVTLRSPTLVKTIKLVTQ